MGSIGQLSGLARLAARLWRPPRVFLNYRRSDSGGYSGRLFDGLAARLGHDRVFKDVEDIRAGEEYVAAINTAITAADALLVVIGPDWLAPAEGKETPRLFDAGDMVRMEVQEGLRQPVRVIPVLVGGAGMPAPEQLPLELRPLVLHNAVELRDTHWPEDFERLLQELMGGSRRRPGGADLAGWSLLVLTGALDIFSRNGLSAPGTLVLVGLAAVAFAKGAWDARLRLRRWGFLGWTGAAVSAVVLLVTLRWLVSG